MDFKKINPGLIAIIIVLIILIVIIVAALSGALRLNLGNVNTGTSSTTTQTANSSTATVDLGTINFAGITEEDTIVLGDKLTNIVIALEQRQWKTLQWSPDRSRLAAMGVTDANTDKSVYNLFIYNLATRKWEQLTAYDIQDATGVTGYTWEDNSNLILTQGINPDNWIHRLNLDNRTINKLFRVEGQLILFTKPGYYINQGIIDNQKQFLIYAGNGQSAFIIKSSALGQANLNLIGIQPGMEEGEFILFARDQLGVSSFRWSFHEPEYTPLVAKLKDVIAFCSAGDRTLFALSVGFDRYLEVGLLNRTNGFYRDLGGLAVDYALGIKQIIPEKVDCLGNRTTLAISTQQDIGLRWYTWQEEKLQELINARNFRELRLY